MTADEFNRIQHEHAKRALEKHFKEMDPQTTIEYTARPDGMVLKIKNAKVSEGIGSVVYETLNGDALAVYNVPDGDLKIHIPGCSYRRKWIL